MTPGEAPGERLGRSYRSENTRTRPPGSPRLGVYRTHRAAWGPARLLPRNDAQETDECPATESPARKREPDLSIGRLGAVCRRRRGWRRAPEPHARTPRCLQNDHRSNSLRVWLRVRVRCTHMQLCDYEHGDGRGATCQLASVGDRRRVGNELEKEEEKPREKRRRHVQAPRRDASPLRPLHAEPRVRTQARAATCLRALCAHSGRETRRRKDKGIKAEEAARPSCSRRVPPSLRRDKSPSAKDRTWLGSPASPGDKLHTHARRRAAAGPPGRHRSRRGASRPPQAGQLHVRPRRVTRTRPGPLASRPACRELGSHHSRPSRKRKQP